VATPEEPKFKTAKPKRGFNSDGVTDTEEAENLAFGEEVAEMEAEGREVLNTDGEIDEEKLAE